MSIKRKKNFSHSSHASRKGWYKILNQRKFVKPLDEYMQSTLVKDNECYIQYKSNLERIAFCYADLNPKVQKFSIEPFSIPYVKPLDNQVHRYFVDMFIEFATGDKFLVEIKPYHETMMPEQPKVKSPNAVLRYKEQVETYLVNQAKWKAASEFAASKGMKFIVLTEKQLKPS